MVIRVDCRIWQIINVVQGLQASLCPKLACLALVMPNPIHPCEKGIEKLGGKRQLLRFTVGVQYTCRDETHASDCKQACLKVNCGAGLKASFLPFTTCELISTQ